MPETNAPGMALLSASLLCLVLGSVHAFSVFLEPLEQGLSEPRSIVSLTYSFALVCLTIAVLFGHWIFSKVTPALLVILVCGVASTGAVIAAYSPSITLVWLGYSVIFGGANGLGYAFGLHLSAQANPGREGLAMGVVTACYALGATLAPMAFAWALSAGGFQFAMLGLSAILIAIAPVCAMLLSRSGIIFQGETPSSHRKLGFDIRIIWLWLAYGTAVTAGLMAIGHATAIAKLGGLQNALWMAAAIIAVFNMIGSLSGGWLSDRLKHAHLLCGLSIVSAVALVMLGLARETAICLAGLGIVGFTYGALIAIYPATIAKMFGQLRGPRVYGRVFTAWGTAGLFGPWFAGYLFDLNGDYTVALLTAAALGLLSAIVIILPFRQSV